MRRRNGVAIIIAWDAASQLRPLIHMIALLGTLIGRWAGLVTRKTGVASTRIKVAKRRSRKSLSQNNLMTVITCIQITKLHGRRTRRYGAVRMLTELARQSPTIATLAMTIGKMGGPIRKRSGVVTTITRVVSPHLLPNHLIAMPGIPIGKQDGQMKRSRGVAITMIRAANQLRPSPHLGQHLLPLFLLTRSTATLVM
jgi:hypothetical protein